MRTATHTFHADGWTCMQYHQTVVAKCKPLPSNGARDRRVKLDSGGRMTVTTKRRMNEFAHEQGLDFIVYQEDFDWYVTISQDWASPLPFDGYTAEFTVRGES